MTKQKLNLTIPDCTGYTPDQSKINTVWYHFKDPSTRYYITGFSWDAERDIWEYTFREQNGFVTFTRSPTNFHGLVTAKSDRVPEGFIDCYVERYKEIPVVLHFRRK